MADPALKRAREAERRPTIPSGKRGNRIQDTYTAYNFPWPEIEEFLKAKWPGWDFRPVRVCHVPLLQEAKLTENAVQRQVGV
jgi:hypothetical protein